MASLPRPLLGALVAVLALFAAWTFVLKPRSASQSAVAPPAVQTPPPAPATTPARASTHSATQGSKTRTATSVAPKADRALAEARERAAVRRRTAAATQRSAEVTRALAEGKVLAVLFYNPAAADDIADLHELSAIPTDRGHVVTVAIPISELSRYGEITDQVPVTGSPTLVVIDASHRAQTLVGFADQLEYDHLVAGALGAR